MQVRRAGPSTETENARARLAMHSYGNDVLEEIWGSHEEESKNSRWCLLQKLKKIYFSAGCFPTSGKQIISS